MIASTSISRRNFLKTTTTAALATSVFSVAPHALAATKRGKWPVGCRDVHLHFVNKADSWAALKQLDADCFEADVDDALVLSNLVAPGKNYTVGTAQGIAALKADLKANRRVISAFCMHNRFDERLDKEIEICSQVANAAEKCGVPVIRIDVVPRALKLDEFPAFAATACKQLCDSTRGSRTLFAIENHGRATNDPNLMERILNEVGSDRLGITLDTANLYWWGHPLDEIYRIYERFAPRVFHTHCKSIRYPEDKRNVKREMGWAYDKYSCPVYEGDIDFKRLFAILRKAGYRGDLCIENESLGRVAEGERAAILKREISFLRELE